MKSYDEFIDEIIKKAQTVKKRKKIKRSIISLSLAAVMVFAVLFSNIIDFSFLSYSSAYKNFMRSYVSQSGVYTSLKILDAENAALTIDGKIYPCKLESKSKKTFSLVSYTETRNSESQGLQTQKFFVKFSGSSATVTGEYEGNDFRSVLNITEDIAIECGVWGLFGIQGLGSQINYDISGAGWILLLPDGSSYMGEGSDSVYPSYFTGVGNQIIQLYSDPLSNLTYAASFEYIDDGSFDFPAIRQSYLEDGDKFYYYFKLLKDNELFAFNGGSFKAEGATSERYNSEISKDEIISQNEVKWQLLPDSDADLHIIDAEFNINLNTDGSVNFSISGNRKYKTSSNGTWYRLKHCVLVLLNKSNKLTGKAFTMFDDNRQSSLGYDEESFLKSAVTTVYSYKPYKVGYHAFYYFCLETDTKIYWGSGYDKEHLLPKLYYNTPYILEGKYFAAYYDSDNDDFLTVPKHERFKDLPLNGRLSLIFTENGYLEIYKDGVMEKKVNFYKRDPYYYGENSLIIFSDIYIYYGKREHIKIDSFHVGAGRFDFYSSGGYNNGVTVEPKTYYEFTFKADLR